MWMGSRVSVTLGDLFFQAEDGIRDDLVTGVQTCALPISVVPFQELAASAIRGRIDEVLGNPEYRQNAMRFKRIIAETDGLARAAQMLENAFDLKPENLSDASQNPV